MNFPEDLLYTKDHEWLRVKGNQGTVGVTDFAQSELGDIVYVDIDTLDDQVAKDGVFGTVEAVKTVSDLFMPVSGTVTELNSALESNPAAVNDDPYGDGWLVKITLSDLSECDSLLSASEYAEMIGQ